MRLLGTLFVLVLATGAVSLLVGVLTRGRVLATTISLLVVEAGILLFLYHNIGSSNSPDVVEVIGLPPLLAVLALPIVFPTAFFTIRFVERGRKLEDDAT